MTLAFFYVEAFAIFVVASALAASIELNQLQERGVVPRLGGLQGARVLASFAPSVRNASTRI